MKIIKELSEMIEEELEVAEEYIKEAMRLKETYPEISKVFYDISIEEMRHVNLLHDEVKKVIADHRKTHGDPPAPMQAVYDFLHERHMNEANEIKIMQSQYR